MKPDIQNRNDIDLILKSFYDKLLSDLRISPIFTDVAHTDLQTHLPHLGDFWENILFHTVDYQKHVMNIHLQFHQQYPFTPAHFQLWLDYFGQSIDEMYEGEVAQNMKDRAYSIAYIMRTKFIKP